MITGIKKTFTAGRPDHMGALAYFFVAGNRLLSDA